MRIYCYPADTTACGSYRIAWPALALAAQGHDVTVVMPNQRTDTRYAVYGELDGDRLVGAYAPDDADVIVLQRVTNRHLAAAIPMFRATGVAVVVDMDDDLSAIHPANPVFAALHPNTGGGHSWQHAQTACEAATLVTVSTDALLARYAPHGRGRVLHNCVPARYLDVPHTDSDLIGWPGAVFSHPDDLQQVGPSIARLVRAGHRFRIVGPPDGAQAVLGLDTAPESTGVVPLEEWPIALAQLGIGIAPLADTAFNQSKSALKPQELMSTGVPWVASPRVEYARLHRLGAGLLADRPKDWYRQLTRLLREPGMRADLSAAGRELAATMTIEGQAWRWADAWADALRIQRRTTAPLVRAQRS